MAKLKKKGQTEGQEWVRMVNMLSHFESSGMHLDDLLDRQPPERLRWLLMEVFRCWWIIESVLEARIKRVPRPIAHAILRLALAECLNRSTDAHPRIIHHAVEVGHSCGLNQAETGFLNGVLRAVIRGGDLDGDLLGRSHPTWMQARWVSTFGESATRELLAWNQREPRLTISATGCPDYCELTEWDGYYRLLAGKFGEARKDLETGRVYIQDPFARIPVNLLAVRPNEKVVDLCAAPGGKSRLLAKALGGTGRLILVDRPGRRIDRLCKNVRYLPGAGSIEVIASKLEDLEAAGPEAGLNPEVADAVLIDVPCSNTGVIQKRPDVKVRLKEADIARLSAQQEALLSLAARWVRPGGRLAYSTCSIEPEENTGVVNSFLDATPGWEQTASVMSYPWECGHDGGGAFLLTKLPTSERKRERI